MKKLKNNSRLTKIRFSSKKRIKSLKIIRKKEKISPSKKELRNLPRLTNLDWLRWILDMNLSQNLKLRSLMRLREVSVIKTSIRLSWKIWLFNLWSNWWKRRLNLSASKRIFPLLRALRKIVKNHFKISWRPITLFLSQPLSPSIKITILKMKIQRPLEELFLNVLMEKFNASILSTLELKWFSKSIYQKSDPVCSRTLSEFDFFI